VFEVGVLTWMCLGIDVVGQIGQWLRPKWKVFQRRVWVLVGKNLQGWLVGLAGGRLEVRMLVRACVTT
jgi:hypothetical protein